MERPVRSVSGSVCGLAMVPLPRTRRRRLGDSVLANLRCRRRAALAGPDYPAIRWLAGLAAEALTWTHDRLYKR